jgi:hypothetical protein
MSHREKWSMAKYLVDCTCGRQHTVETRQAGESMVCECGATVPIPTLRQLRQLPEASAATAGIAASGPTWGGRQRTITVSLLLAAVFLAVAAMSRSLEVPVPVLDPVAYTKNVDRLVGTMTPLQAWERWQDTYEPLRTTGFEVFKHPAEKLMTQALTWHKGVQRIALGLAAVCGAVAVVTWFSKGGRQGDKETRRS